MICVYNLGCMQNRNIGYRQGTLNQKIRQFRDEIWVCLIHLPGPLMFECAPNLYGPSTTTWASGPLYAKNTSPSGRAATLFISLSNTFTYNKAWSHEIHFSAFH